MQRNRSFWKKMIVFGLVASMSLPLAGVYAQTDEPTEEPADVAPIELEAVDPLGLTGDIAIAGSSTVEPVTVAMAARFNEDGFTGSIAIAETGSGAGFERFCVEGSTDISNASRPINDSELESCTSIGRTVLEFLIGIDALTVAVNPDSPVDQLTHSQLIDIFTGVVTTWDQVNPDWPAEPIQLFTPGTDSGTFDFFGEAVLGDKGAYAEGEARTGALLAPNPTTSENDNVLVEGIAGSPNAIGYFGFAYYINNQDRLKAVAIANDVEWDDEGNVTVLPEDQITYVVPSAETAESGEYMLSRPLFIYSASEILAEKPQVAAFINYYLTNAPEVVVEVGYFPVSTEVYNASKQIWLDATSGAAAPEAMTATEAAQ